MAHSLSAKKRVRQNEKRRARNRARKTEIRDLVKGFNAAVTAGDATKAAAELNSAVSVLDKVASKHTIHKNAAARKRSRLTLKLNALKAGKIGPKADKAKADKAKSDKAAKGGKGKKAAATA